MGILAQSKPADLETHWGAFGAHPLFAWVRRPELGVVVIRARASRTGTLFDLGEMTVTRCSVELEGGIVGHAYVAGRDKRHAAIAAIFDALMQCSGEQRRGAEVILADLQSRLERRRAKTTAQAYASAVDFFMQLQEDS